MGRSRPCVDGRALIPLFVVALDYPLDATGVRQGQVRQLADFVQESTRRRHPIVVCGDFNAGPDSDEIRMLTGRTVTAAPGLVFYDVWELAGDGTAGVTWSNRQPAGGSGHVPGPATSPDHVPHQRTPHRQPARRGWPSPHRP